jgi:hypothetical protein
MNTRTYLHGIIHDLLADIKTPNTATTKVLNAMAMAATTSLAAGK